MTTNTYDLNLVPGVYAPVIVNVSQYDAGARDIQMRLYNDAMPFVIPQTAGVTVQGTKADDTGFQYPCEFEGNVVTWTVADQMTVFSGVIVCELKIVEGDEVLGTANFTLAVEPTALRDDTVISETDLPLLQIAADVAAYAPAVARDARMAADAVEQANEVLQTVTDAVDIAEDAKTSSQASATAAAGSATAAASSASDAASSAADAADAAEQAQHGINEAKTVQNKSGEGSIEFGIDSTTGKGQYRATGASDWIPFLNEFPGDYEAISGNPLFRYTSPRLYTMQFSEIDLAPYNEAIVMLWSAASYTGMVNLTRYLTIYHAERSAGTWTQRGILALSDSNNPDAMGRLSLNTLNNTSFIVSNPGLAQGWEQFLYAYMIVGIGGKNE